MEIEGEDGTKLQLNKHSITEFGRGSGFQFDDRTVSRRHISLRISKNDEESRVCFEVLGKNPIWVLSNDTKEIRVFRNSEKGELSVGDGFCVSCKNPIFFTLKKIGGFERKSEEEGKRVEMDRIERIPVDTEMAESIPSVGDKEGGGFDASEIDPVKEFGFLKMGHEFDNFPRHKIRGIKDMDWFLEEQKQDSEDDEENRSKKRKRFGRKKNDNAMEDDDDWTGESEDEKVTISKLGLGKRPKTRSKDKNGKIQDVGSSKNSSRKKTIHANDEDEDDETLGGFIVDDEGVDEEEENDDDTDDEEEEEEEDDYNEDDDDE
ncbi:hypothetical protein MKW94_029269 [Papaver nudicaule]|uniref:FHA domain-containing protein n=1 Tax=Papaver nudicaule TaxID=74823 RepID=A0AA41V409_PAPNU|nr:hypothetical protein [Papaver nudicaule]